MNNRKNLIKFYIFIIKTIKKDNNMSQKIALVTGGSSGIGRELAIELANKDYKVFITGKNKYELSVTEHNAKNYATIIPIVVNFNQPRFEEKILSFLTDNLEKNEKIDKLIHCAATTAAKPIQSFKDTLNECIHVNEKAPIQLTQTLLEKKFCHSNTRILFLDADCVLTDARQAIYLYHISKFALNIKVNYLRSELKNQVLIGLFNPGPTKNTKIFNQLQEEKLKQIENQVNVASLPIQSTEPTEPQEVAEFIVKILEVTSNQEFTKINWDYRKKEEQLKNIETSAAESEQVGSGIEAAELQINKTSQQISNKPSFFSKNPIAVAPPITKHGINASISSIWKLNTFT